jgi:hypothetical protein
MWREIRIAGFVAGAITIVLLARRWTQLALGTGTLNQEFFAGNLAVGTLVSAVESRMAEGGPSVHERPQQPTRPAGADVPGGSEDDGSKSE